MLKQSLQQKMLQKLSPQQIQLMKLLQVPSIALEQRIKEELEINPALEEGADDSYEEETFDQNIDADDSEMSDLEKKTDDIDMSEYLNDDDYPYYKTQSNNYAEDDQQREIPFSVGKSFQETLIEQIGLQNFTDKQKIIAQTIIGNIDDDGYLMRTISAMSDDLAFSQGVDASEKEVNEVLKLVQDFEPAGIAAQNLQECLIIQLRKKEQKNQSTEIAINILEKHFEEFSKRHYDKIIKKIGCTEQDLKEAIDQILKLNPRPGGSIGTSNRSTSIIIPDFTLVNDDGELELMINSKNSPELRVSRTFRNLLEESAHKEKKSKEDKETITFIKQKIEAAKWFIDAINQRQETLTDTMSTIVKMQYNYFLSGNDADLKPMKYEDVATLVGLDISTISRVVNSKYIETPFGTFPLRHFFSEGMMNDAGEEISTKEIKKIIREEVDAENKSKPLTDEKIVEALKTKGYNVARRTVAKYREQLDIPVARLRKEL